MCFGMTTTGSQTTIPSNDIQYAGKYNLGFAQNLANQPFNAPLQGVAGFSPLQSQGFSAIGDLASAPNANNPFYNQISNDFSSYGSAPAAKIFAPSVLGGGTNAFTANLSDYVDPNLAFELNPTLANITRQANIAKYGPGGVGSAATAAGAFGDARQGVENANVDEAAMRQAAQATAGAYQNAFTNAANLRGVDVSNLIGAQTTNAGLNEQALQRMLGSGNALQNLAQFQTGTGLTLGNALLQAGGQQQQNQQQILNAAYNQQLQNLLGPYQYQLPALNSALTAALKSQPSVTTTQQPNNALWALLGGGAGALAKGLGGAASGVGTGLGSLFGSAGSLFGGAGAAGTGGAGAMDAALAALAL
jgi:hypothetical protein